MKAPCTWILIADGGGARVLERRGKAGALTEVADMRVKQKIPPSRDMVSDRPGRAFESASSARHAYEPSTDPHREEKRKFARQIVDRLGECLAAKRFDQLVLVAAPAMLGDLRAALQHASGLAGTVVGELDRDLTKVADRDIPGHLDGIAGL